MAYRSPHAAKDPKTTAAQRGPSDSKQIIQTMTYTRSCNKQSPAASAAAARVHKQADTTDKNGKRSQVAKSDVIAVVWTLAPVRQAATATAATPKTGKQVAKTLIKAAAADEKVSGAIGGRKQANACGEKGSSTIKKQQRAEASGANPHSKVKSPTSKPSRAQTPMKHARAGAKTAGAKDRT